MTGPETDSETQSQPQPKRASPHRKAILVAAILVFAIFFWLYASKLLGVKAAEREGIQSSAGALAAASLPLLDLRSKNLLGDDATLQRVVDEIAKSHGFSFAAILDNTGQVLAASDRSTATGSAYPEFKSGEFVER